MIEIFGIKDQSMGSTSSELEPRLRTAPQGGIAVGESVPPAAAAPRTRSGVLLDYVSIARPDHWFKNVFMVVGIILGGFYYPSLITYELLWRVPWAIAAVCLLASSNYVLNEILDARTDRSHPVKRFRPIPSGRVRPTVAYLEWVALGVAGSAVASRVNLPFLFTGVFLLGMGIVYNVPPVRSKEVPYIDVLSESVNNAIRLAMGWFVVTESAIPPLSLVVAYWMAGAFFMAAKRFAEYRSIGDPDRAAAYRASFRYYDEAKLLTSMFFYATASALFLGVFIVRYHLELILSLPLIAGFFSWYMHVTLKDESAAQAPERLYRERGLMVYLCVCVAAFMLLMFVRVSALYDWFNFQPSPIPSLWEF